jgi:hypothetical protein
MPGDVWQISKRTRHKGKFLLIAERARIRKAKAQ